MTVWVRIKLVMLAEALAVYFDFLVDLLGAAVDPDGVGGQESLNG